MAKEKEQPIRTWIVTRYVKEEYEAEARTAKEAKEVVSNWGNPNRITVTAETARVKHE